MTAYGHDFHQTTVAKIEAAQRPLRVRELADFAALYGVGVQDLVHGPSPARSIAEIDREIADVMKRLGRAQQVAATAAAHLETARQALRAAEAVHRTSSADVTTLETRLTALTADRKKLPRWESDVEPSSKRSSSEAQRSAPSWTAGSEPAVLRILLGAQLRRLREAKRIPLEEAAQTIRASHSKISRLESGRIAIKERDALELFTLYGVTEDAQLEQLRELVQRSNAPSWWQRYNDVLPSWFEEYMALESAAAEIRMYEAQYVPDMFQTEDYARFSTLQEDEDGSRRATERIMQLRTARKMMFIEEASPRKLQIVLDEAVLRRQVGGPEVMRDQLRLMLELAQRPNITIQVVPLKNNNHPALTSFRILNFSETDLREIVYIEQLTSAQYLEGTQQVEAYKRVMNQLTRQALMPSETSSFLRQLLAA